MPGTWQRGDNRLLLKEAQVSPEMDWNQVKGTSSVAGQPGSHRPWRRRVPQAQGALEAACSASPACSSMKPHRQPGEGLREPAAAGEARGESLQPELSRGTLLPLCNDPQGCLGCSRRESQLRGVSHT